MNMIAIIIIIIIIITIIIITIIINFTLYSNVSQSSYAEKKTIDKNPAAIK